MTNSESNKTPATPLTRSLALPAPPPHLLFEFRAALTVAGMSSSTLASSFFAVCSILLRRTRRSSAPRHLHLRIFETGAAAEHVAFYAKGWRQRRAVQRCGNRGIASNCRSSLTGLEMHEWCSMFAAAVIGTRLHFGVSVSCVCMAVYLLVLK